MVRLLGAALILAGCGGFGFTLSAARRREIRMLRQLIRALQEVQWELKYRMTALPELCRTAAMASGGILKDIFLELAGKLERREVMDLSGSLNAIVSEREVPRRVKQNLRQLGASLGRYDLEGQLQGLEAVRRQCRKDLKELEENCASQLRSYQTLALCAGAALAILFF